MRSSTSARQESTWATPPGSRTSSAPSRSPPRRARPTLHAHPTISQCRTGCSATCAADWQAHGRGGGSRASDSAAHNLLRFSRNVRYVAALPRTGNWDDRAPAHRGVPGSLRSRGAPLPRGRHAPPPRRPFDWRETTSKARSTTSERLVPLAREAGDPQQRVPWLIGMRSPARRGREARRRATSSPTRRFGRPSSIRVLGSRRPRVRRRRARMHRRSSLSSSNAAHRRSGSMRRAPLLRHDFVQRRRDARRDR